MLFRASFRPASFAALAAAALLAGGLALTGVPAVRAQGAPEGKPAAENAAQRLWSVSCSDSAAGGGSQCQMVQTLAMKKTGKRLLTVAVQKKDAEGHARLIIGLPHGVYFPAGIDISVDDGAKTQVQVETSDPNGAYAVGEIDDGLLQALREGKTLKVGFQSGKRQPLVIPVSLKGFADAYQRVASFGG